VLKLWDVPAGRERSSSPAGEGGLGALAFHPEGKVVAVAGDDKKVHLRDAETGKAIRSLEGHGEVVKSLAFHPDGEVLASASADKTVILWDMGQGERIHTYAGHEKSLNVVAFDPEGKILASGGYDTNIELWDVAATIAAKGGKKR
jgi:WD40 repeat protein